MSLIKEKEQIKSDEKIMGNPLSDSRQKSIYMAKELIKKLLHDTLDNSLLKLESNTSNYMTSLKTSSKSLNDYSKIINNLIKNVEENKKKKTKDKKPQVFKRGIMKTLTQQNLLTRSRTIESNLNQFKSKGVLGTINNKKSNINKNNNLKFFKKVNPNSKNISYKTTINFRTNDNESIEDTASQKYIRFPANNTVQNFRKNIFKSGPEEPRRKMKSKIKDKRLDRTFYQYDKGKKSVTNLFHNKINNAKKLEHFPEKNLHSRTLTLNTLTDIDERIESISVNNRTTKNMRNPKGFLFKNEKKTTFVKLNNQLDKIDEKKNKISNSKTLVKNKEKDINEIQVENIVKLVDNVNQNLNKILNENPSRKNINNKEGNNKINKIQEKFRRSKTLVYDIKDTEIKQIIDNKNESNKIENEKNENKDTIIVNDNNIKEKKEIKDNIKDISLPKSDIKANSNKKIFDINKKPKKEENNFINKIINITNKEVEEIKIIKLRKNKSNPKTMSMNNVFKINNNNTKYHRSFKEIINVINVNENKKEQITKGIIDTEKKDENSYKKINIEIIRQIRYKMKEKVDKINEQNKILEKKLLNQSNNNIINSEQIDKKGKLDGNQNVDNNGEKNNIDIKDKKENIRNVNLKENRSSNKSLKNVIKNKIICDNIIKRVKSVGKIRNKYLLI